MKDKRKTFWLYVALAYLITWIPWIPLERYAAQYGYVLPNPQTLPVLFENQLQDRTQLVLVLLSSAMILFSGPLIAAIIASAVESGRKGVSDLWRTSTRWKIGGRWYGIMLAILLFINLPALLIGLVRGPLPEAGQVFTILIWLIPVFIYTFFVSGLEEPGWRGYALPNLQARFSASRSSVIVGIVWGIWHWPVFLPVYNSVLSSPCGSVPFASTSRIFSWMLSTAISQPPQDAAQYMANLGLPLVLIQPPPQHFLECW